MNEWRSIEITGWSKDDYMSKQLECKHDEDLEYGLIIPTYYNSKEYDQDICCSKCHKVLYVLDSDRVTVWQRRYMQNPIRIDPDRDDKRLLRFINKSIRKTALDLINEIDNEIRFENINREELK